MRPLPWLNGAPRSWLLPGALLLTCSALPLSTQAQSGNDALPRLEPAECATATLTALGAECYTFHGEENWDSPNGNSVALPVAVFQPEHAEDGGVPVFFFPGGPGYSSLDNRGYLEQLLKDVGERTLVTMDHRGFIHAEP